MAVEMLVTIDEARAHILLPPLVGGSPTTPDESDQVLKLGAAQEMIVQYLGSNFDELWDAATVPLLVKMAILVQFAELVRFRGDEQEGEGPNQTDGHLSPQVTNYLRRWRDPVLR